jgi:hypothetical protein
MIAMMIRLALTVLLGYAAAFWSGWWLFAFLMLIGLAIEGQAYFNKRFQAWR